MKFVLFVEGYTEKAVLGRFLRDWLNTRLGWSLEIQTVRFDGCFHMIGDMPLKAKMHLNAPSASTVIAVIALLDLYGPDFYPNYTISVDDRVQWATKYLEDKVSSSKFKVFFAVHELEAWLLSQPEIFPPAVKQALPGKAPEEINFQTPPSKLLRKIYRSKLKREYKKVTDGQNLFKKLDSEIAYRKCNHLKQMLDEMLRMAKETGL